MHEPSLAPLPHVVAPLPDEPLMGVLTRLLEINAYRSLAWLSDVSDLRRQHHHIVARRPESHPEFNQRTRLSSDDIKRMAYHPIGNGRVRYFGIAIRAALVSVRHRKACSMCLQEAAYHRAFWDLTPITICHEHGILLLDRCVSCLKPLSWGGNRITHCRCGADLRRAPVTTMADEYVAPVRTVAARLGLRADGDALNNVLFGTLDGGELLWLMLNLASFVFGAPNLTSGRVILGHAKTIHAALSLGHGALVGWPDSFEDFLGRMVNVGGQQRAGAVRLNLQHMVHWLAETDCWPDVRDAIELALRRHMNR